METTEKKLEYYRQSIEKILNHYGSAKPANGEIEVYTFFDRQPDHYQVFHAGWNRHIRIFGPLIYIDILNHKIWIQHDGTEVGIANELVDLGIPKEEIVLAYHAPFMRQYDGFAVN
ncbi:MAG: XisI protein [Roseofilum sp. SBFL]|uniref:XisI protein n=1 Tax=unclassified Roseofilum TaxID=2620099 RepID=UPI000E93792A|nr:MULTISPECIES: XisI protein [unclassified Roseofilum]HBQ97050.1 XisI protein [Cyanobacteria bacterium UBA11691]MBP0011732.1 XisI protein [Roseofilum sp. SID3]MBP0024017.1 XisI protein [Roseofilum sp. SID2]MBP0032698.1 XisI protein [Roseofilum sp. Belize BBD 4]MBP0039124.1 XisI protein [Roseofilum sp. SID1]